MDSLIRFEDEQGSEHARLRKFRAILVTFIPDAVLSSRLLNLSDTVVKSIKSVNGSEYFHRAKTLLTFGCFFG